MNKDKIIDARACAKTVFNALPQDPNEHMMLLAFEGSALDGWDTFFTLHGHGPRPDNDADIKEYVQLVRSVIAAKQS